MRKHKAVSNRICSQCFSASTDNSCDKLNALGIIFLLNIVALQYFVFLASVEIQCYCSQLLWRSVSFGGRESGRVICGPAAKKRPEGLGSRGGKKKFRERAEDGVKIHICTLVRMQLDTKCFKAWLRLRFKPAVLKLWVYLKAIVWDCYT